LAALLRLDCMAVAGLSASSLACLHSALMPLLAACLLCCACSRPAEEPAQPITHWEFMLREMQWLANDMAQVCGQPRGSGRRSWLPLPAAAAAVAVSA
jgi:hypothetical protein